MKINLSKSQWELIGKTAGWIKTAKWIMRVQETYSSLEELEAYDETYGIAKRCGFRSAKELWDTNPLLKGGVNPGELGLATQDEYATYEKEGPKP